MAARVPRENTTQDMEFGRAEQLLRTTCHSIEPQAPAAVAPVLQRDLHLPASRAARRLPVVHHPDLPLAEAVGGYFQAVSLRRPLSKPPSADAVDARTVPFGRVSFLNPLTRRGQGGPVFVGGGTD